MRYKVINKESCFYGRILECTGTDYIVYLKTNKDDKDDLDDFEMVFCTDEVELVNE